jgi:formylglycine-generating enzyme required for sulfatase activity
MVPVGQFLMGSSPVEIAALNKEFSHFGNVSTAANVEGPQHRVKIARPFAVGRFAVTFGEWDACIADGACNDYRPKDAGWGRGRQPVINVDWDDAKSYVAWLSRKTGKAYRLLSEAEREYVTRAGTRTAYWWGESVSTNQANYAPPMPAAAILDFKIRTAPVDSFAPNPWGLFQVHGNVNELVEDCWHNSYEGAPADGSAWVTDCEKDLLNIMEVVARGGGLRFAANLRAANRDPIPVNERGEGVTEMGFRVARDVKR